MINCINGDNKDYLPRYQDKSFTVVFDDPPYGIGESGKNHKSRNTLVRQKGGELRRCPSNKYDRKEWDNQPADSVHFEETKRVSEHRIIFGANYFESIMVPCKSPRRAQFEQFLIDNPVGFIIWDKCNGTTDFNDCEIIYTSFSFPSFVLKYMWAGMMQGKSISEGHIMQGDKSLNQKRLHPTEKPISLYKYLLKMCIDIIGTTKISVLDPHGGCLSLAIACYDMDVNLQIIEKETDYYMKGTKRYLEYKTAYPKIIF